LLGLAGCTGGGDDPPASSSTTSGASTTSSPATGSTTTSPTTSGPADAYPAAARAHTVEGGKAFVEYYYATLNAVLRQPRTGVLPDLGADVCEFCKKNEKRVTDLVAGKGRYDSTVVQLARLKPLEGAPTGQQYYRADSTQLGAWILDSTGKKFQQDRKIAIPVTLVVTWSEGRWKLYGAEKA
jgi:hypothetical protein